MNPGFDYWLHNKKFQLKVIPINISNLQVKDYILQ